MSWLVRLGCLCVLIALMSACNTDDTGKPCKLTQEKNVTNLKDLDTKARIVEASAACDIESYCFANFYDETKHDVPNNTNQLGYCSKKCQPDQNECPKGFTCTIFINVDTLPAQYKGILEPIHKQYICMKEPPTAGEQ